MLALLCACDRGAGKAAGGKDGKTTQTRADGTVTVSGDDAIAARLTWRSPVVVLDDAGIPAARTRAAAALAEGRLYEDAEAAIPLYLALLARDPEDARAKTGLNRALVRLAKAGDEALAASGDDADALRRAHAIAAVMRSVGIERIDGIRVGLVDPRPGRSPIGLAHREPPPVKQFSSLFKPSLIRLFTVGSGTARVSETST